MPQQEQGVQLQTDTLAPTGAPLRIIISGANVTVGTAPVATGQQVVSVADGTGAVIDTFADTYTDLLVLNELRQIRLLLAQLLGVPVLAPPIPGVQQELYAANN